MRTLLVKLALATILACLMTECTAVAITKCIVIDVRCGQ